MKFKYEINKNIQNREPLLEPFILESSKHSYFYSKQILKRPWDKAEETLLRSPDKINNFHKLPDPKFIYLYAKNVLKKRWKKGEEVLLSAANLDINENKNAYWVINHYRNDAKKVLALYAKHVIKGRWKEAESFIANTSQMSLYLSVLTKEEAKDFQNRIMMEAIGGSKQAERYLSWKPTHRIKIKGAKAFDVMLDPEKKDRWGFDARSYGWRHAQGVFEAGKTTKICRAFDIQEWMANVERSGPVSLEYDMDTDRWYWKRQSAPRPPSNNNFDNLDRWLLKGTVTPIG